jgi:RsiW-degrading membrane proteinase PrsW (M82 family)
MEANSLSISHDRRRTRRRAFFLVVSAVLLEVVLLMPFVDHLADANQTIHFTQHGFIFGGGVLLGMALRDVQRASRR